jgi:hypothetical protein
VILNELHCNCEFLPGEGCNASQLRLPELFTIISNRYNFQIEMQK